MDLLESIRAWKMETQDLIDEIEQARLKAESAKQLIDDITPPAVGDRLQYEKAQGPTLKQQISRAVRGPRAYEASR